MNPEQYIEFIKTAQPGILSKVMTRIGQTGKSSRAGLKNFFEGFKAGLNKWSPLPVKSKYLNEVQHFGKTTLDKVDPKTISGHAGAFAGQYLTPIGFVGGMLGVTDALSVAKEKIKSKITVEPKQKAIIESLQETDDIIKKAPTQQVNEAYDLMKSHAPTLSTDKGVVRDFVRRAVQFEGVDYNTVKQLADAETSVLRAREMGDTSLTGQISKTLAKTVGSVAT